MTRFLAPLLAGAATFASAAAQGSDDCSQAQPITGEGTFPFDNRAATTDGPLLTLCSPDALARDVWWEWTAPRDGVFRLSTYGLCDWRTVLAVYSDLICPVGFEIACAFPNCSDPHGCLLVFTAQAGQTYKLRAGGMTPGEVGLGAIEIREHDCIGAPDDALEPNDYCQQGRSLANGTYSNLMLAAQDEDWYELGVADQDTLTVDIAWTRPFPVARAALYARCQDTLLLTRSIDCFVDQGMQLAWTNTTGEYAYLALRLDFVVDIPGWSCSRYEMMVAGSFNGSIGSQFCSRESNSSGGEAELWAFGSASVSAAALHLQAYSVPNQSGIFFHGANAVELPFGNGYLCTAGDVRRGQPQAPHAHVAFYDYDGSDARHSLTGFVGSTRHFQYWFRDTLGGGAQYNTSDALSLLLTP